MIDSIVFDNAIRIDKNICYLVMLDYDRMSMKEVLRDIHSLQSTFRLMTATIYRTEHGYHAVFFYDQFISWKDCMAVIMASCCDHRYKDIAIKTGKVSTRISMRNGKPDKRFIKDTYVYEKASFLNNEIPSENLKDGNQIRDMYDSLLKLQLDLNEDIWN